MNKNELAADEFLELCAEAALDGVSLVAVEIKTGEVVSAIFNEIKVPNVGGKPFFEVFAEERLTQTASQAVVEFMVDLDKRCDLFEKFGADCGFEMMFLGTLRSHRHSRLGTILCRTSLEVAKKLEDGPVSVMTVKDLGPKYSFIIERKPVNKVPKFCQALLTVRPTQKILKELGFTVYLRFPYIEFYFNGNTYSEIWR